MRNNSQRTRSNYSQHARMIREGALGRKLRSDWAYKGRKNKHSAVVNLDPVMYDQGIAFKAL